MNRLRRFFQNPGVREELRKSVQQLGVGFASLLGLLPVIFGISAGVSDAIGPDRQSQVILLIAIVIGTGLGFALITWAMVLIIRIIRYLKVSDPIRRFKSDLINEFYVELDNKVREHI